MQSESTAFTSSPISVGPLARKGFAFHIDAPGTLNFVDAAGENVSLPQSMMAAGQVLYYQATTISAGTTATGRVLHLREGYPSKTFG